MTGPERTPIWPTLIRVPHVQSEYASGLNSSNTPRRSAFRAEHSPATAALPPPAEPEHHLARTSPAAPHASRRIRTHVQSVRSVHHATGWPRIRFDRRSNCSPVCSFPARIHVPRSASRVPGLPPLAPRRHRAGDAVPGSRPSARSDRRELRVRVRMAEFRCRCRSRRHATTFGCRAREASRFRCRACGAVLSRARCAAPDSSGAARNVPRRSQHDDSRVANLARCCFRPARSDASDARSDVHIVGVARRAGSVSFASEDHRRMHDPPPTHDPAMPAAASGRGGGTALAFRAFVSMSPVRVAPRGVAWNAVRFFECLQHLIGISTRVVREDLLQALFRAPGTHHGQLAQDPSRAPRHDADGHLQHAIRTVRATDPLVATRRCVAGAAGTTRRAAARSAGRCPRTTRGERACCRRC